jgi:hypothetical protein
MSTQVRTPRALHAGPVDDAAVPSPSHAAEWAVVCALCVMTIVALLPPAGYVWLHLGDTMDWQVNHARHQAAARAAMLMAGVPATGAALGGMATLLTRRPVNAAGRASAMAAGAFFASLMLTIGGFVWVLHHLTVTF